MKTMVDRNFFVPCGIAVAGTTVWAIALLSLTSRPLWLEDSIDWFYRFWLHIDAFGSIPKQEIIATSGAIPDYLQFFSHGGGLLLLKLLSILILKPSMPSAAIGFVSLGAAIYFAWIWLWWSITTTKPLILVGASVLGICLLWLSPVMLAAFCVVPFLTHPKKWSIGSVLGTTIGLLFLFPSVLSLCASVLVLVALATSSYWNLNWARDYTKHMSASLICTVIVLITFNIYFFFNMPRIPVAVEQKINIDSLIIFEDFVRKEVIDYARHQFNLPIVEEGMDKIPIERFRLKHVNDDLMQLSFFLSRDWGDSFNPNDAPKVTLTFDSTTKTLLPVWLRQLDTKFTYRLSYHHLGQLDIVLPISSFNSFYSGSVDISL